MGLSSSQADGVIGKPLFAVVSTTGLSEQVSAHAPGSIAMALRLVCCGSEICSAHAGDLAASQLYAAEKMC